MGEIKSTLDLVMERTRHLSLSPEERKAQQRDALRREITALVNRFLIHDIPAETVVRRLNDLQAEKASWAEALSAVWEKIDPDADNESVFHLLASACSVDTDPLREAIIDYRSALGALRLRFEERGAERLARVGVRGSAVTVNLEADGDFKDEWDRLRSEMSDRLASLKPL
ncbi:MAG: hypothetical protein PVH30_04195 [Desulfobacterales bacterium]|jgi:hypothetical protein